MNVSRHLRAGRVKICSDCIIARLHRFGFWELGVIVGRRKEGLSMEESCTEISVCRPEFDDLCHLPWIVCSTSSSTAWWALALSSCQRMKGSWWFQSAMEITSEECTDCCIIVHLSIYLSICHRCHILPIARQSIADSVDDLIMLWKVGLGSICVRLSVVSNKSQFTLPHLENIVTRLF